MRIIVIGGGIGGLATALALHRAGAEPVVLEQAPAFSTVGAGINVSANGMRALTWLGADRHVRETSVASEGAEFHDLATGARVSRLVFGADGQRLWGEEFYHVLRADLVDALAHELPPDSLRLGSNVAAVEDRGDRVVVRLADGTEVTGDAAVGADGLRSSVRATLFGPQEAQPTGYVAWRALIDLATSPQLDVGPRSRNWFGPRRHIISYPVAGGRLLNVVAFVPGEEIVSRESWTASGDVQDLRRSFEGSCAEATSIISAIDEAFITAINYREPLATWGEGNIVLLGDAAHPVPPSAAQGACMALEDAVMLGRSYERFHEQGFARVAAEYARRRRPRADRLFGVALNNFRTFNQSDPREIRGRNGRLRGLARLDPDSESTWGWLYGYDVVAGADASSALDGLTAAATTDPLERPEARRAFERWRDGLRPVDFMRGEESLRLGFDRLLRELLPPTADVVERAEYGGVPVLEVGAAARGDGPTVLHLHGGLFTMGSADADAGYAARLADAVDGWSVVPDYRLAPEDEFPAALDDVLSVYRELRERVEGPILVSGLEAGAGLAVSLAVAARDEGIAPPDGLFLVSPWVDLSLRSGSIDANAWTDPWLGRQFLAGHGGSYLHAQDPEDPRISPVYADLRGLAPLEILAAEDEALADDASRLAEAARAAGVDARLTLVPDSVHAFTLFDELPEARAAMKRLEAMAARMRSSRQDVATGRGAER